MIYDFIKTLSKYCFIYICLKRSIIFRCAALSPLSGNEHRRAKRRTAQQEQLQHNHTIPGPRSRSRSHARCWLGSVGLLVARSRALEPRCARLLLGAHDYSKPLDAAQLARCQAGGPRYARLIVSLGKTHSPELAR